MSNKSHLCYNNTYNSVVLKNKPNHKIDDKIKNLDGNIEEHKIRLNDLENNVSTNSQNIENHTHNEFDSLDENVSNNKQDIKTIDSRLTAALSNDLSGFSKVALGKLGVIKGLPLTCPVSYWDDESVHVGGCQAFVIQELYKVYPGLTKEECEAEANALKALNNCYMKAYNGQSITDDELNSNAMYNSSLDPAYLQLIAETGPTTSKIVENAGKFALNIWKRACTCTRNDFPVCTYSPACQFNSTWAIWIGQKHLVATLPESMGGDYGNLPLSAGHGLMAMFFNNVNLFTDQTMQSLIPKEQWPSNLLYHGWGSAGNTTTLRDVAWNAYVALGKPKFYANKYGEPAWTKPTKRIDGIELIRTGKINMSELAYNVVQAQYKRCKESSQPGFGWYEYTHASKEEGLANLAAGLPHNGTEYISGDNFMDKYDDMPWLPYLIEPCLLYLYWKYEGTDTDGNKIYSMSKTHCQDIVASTTLGGTYTIKGPGLSPILGGLDLSSLMAFALWCCCPTATAGLAFLSAQHRIAAQCACSCVSCPIEAKRFDVTIPGMPNMEYNDGTSNFDVMTTSGASMYLPLIMSAQGFGINPMTMFQDCLKDIRDGKCILPINAKNFLICRIGELNAFVGDYSLAIQQPAIKLPYMCMNGCYTDATLEFTERIHEMTKRVSFLTLESAQEGVRKTIENISLYKESNNKYTICLCLAIWESSYYQKKWVDKFYSDQLLMDNIMAAIGKIIAEAGDRPLKVSDFNNKDFNAENSFLSDKSLECAVGATPDEAKNIRNDILLIFCADATGNLLSEECNALTNTKYSNIVAGLPEDFDTSFPKVGDIISCYCYLTDSQEEAQSLVNCIEHDPPQFPWCATIGPGEASGYAGKILVCLCSWNSKNEALSVPLWPAGNLGPKGRPNTPIIRSTYTEMISKDQNIREFENNIQMTPYKFSSENIGKYATKSPYVLMSGGYINCTSAFVNRYQEMVRRLPYSFLELEASQEGVLNAQTKLCVKDQANGRFSMGLCFGIWESQYYQNKWFDKFYKDAELMKALENIIGSLSNKYGNKVSVENINSVPDYGHKLKKSSFLSNHSLKCTLGANAEQSKKIRNDIVLVFCSAPVDPENLMSEECTTLPQTPMFNIHAGLTENFNLPELGDTVTCYYHIIDGSPDDTVNVVKCMTDIIKKNPPNDNKWMIYSGDGAPSNYPGKTLVTMCAWDSDVNNTECSLWPPANLPGEDLKNIRSVSCVVVEPPTII